jgi:hypothetical protein
MSTDRNKNLPMYIDEDIVGTPPLPVGLFIEGASTTGGPARLPGLFPDLSSFAAKASVPAPEKMPSADGGADQRLVDLINKSNQAVAAMTAEMNSVRSNIMSIPQLNAVIAILRRYNVYFESLKDEAEVQSHPLKEEFKKKIDAICDDSNKAIAISQMTIGNCLAEQANQANIWTQTSNDVAKIQQGVVGRWRQIFGFDSNKS